MRLRVLETLASWMARVQAVFVVLFAIHWGFQRLPGVWEDLRVAGRWGLGTVASHFSTHLVGLVGELVLLLLLLTVAEVLRRVSCLLGELAAELRGGVR